MKALPFRKFNASSWSLASAMVTDFARDVIERLNTRLVTDDVEDEAITPSKLAQVPAAGLYKTAAQSVANNTATAIQFDGIAHLTGGEDAPDLDTTSQWRAFIRRDGLYRISGQLGFTPAVGVAANSVLVASIRVNGAEVASASLGAVLGTSMIMHVTKTALLVRGDYVDLMAYQNTGNAQSTYTATNTRPALYLEYVGGI